MRAKGGIVVPQMQLEPPRDVQARVLAVEELPLPYFTLTLEVPHALANTVAGQFVMVQVGDRLEPYLRRAFSVFDVSRAESAAHLQLLGKVIGRGTADLSTQVPGSRLALLGPLGRPFGIDDTGGSRVGLVAGGVGSAALLLLARRLLGHGQSFDVLYGGRSAMDLARRELFEDLARSTGGVLLATTEDGSFGKRGLITEPLERALRDGRYSYVYTCGPMPLMARVATLCESFGIGGEAALETPMGCGYGACLGCAVPHRSGHYALCCRDGPIFSFDEVRWEEAA